MEIVNVFIIDDDDATSFLIEFTLHEKITSDLSIHKFSSVESVLKEKIIQPDIIILDHFLQIINGIEALPMITQHLPDTSIAILSSQTNPELYSKAYKGGIKCYIKKDKQMLSKVTKFINEEILFKQIEKKIGKHIRKKSVATKSNTLKRIVIIQKDIPSYFQKHDLIKKGNLTINTFLTIENFIEEYEYNPSSIIINYSIAKNHLTNSNSLYRIKEKFPSSEIICFSKKAEIETISSLKDYGIDFYVQGSREAAEIIKQLI